MASQKQMLVIVAASDVTKCEKSHVSAIARMLGMRPEVAPVKTEDDLRKALASGKYDVIYLCTHADPDGFGEADRTFSISWPKFGEYICQFKTFQPEGVLVLACCRGGLWKVAQQLFCACQTDIDYICGAAWNLEDADLAVGLHTFLYNMVKRREEPATAAHRATQASGYRFFCHDREEVELNCGPFYWNNPISTPVQPPPVAGEAAPQGGGVSAK